MSTFSDESSNKNLINSESPKVQRTLQACLPYYSNSNSKNQSTTMANRQPIIAIAREPINTVTSFKLTSPQGETIALLGHGNCDAALIGSRIMTLFGVGKQNINNGTILALLTTIGDQVQLNLPDGWLLEIKNGYSTLAQTLNLYGPQVLAQAPAASPRPSVPETTKIQLTVRPKTWVPYRWHPITSNKEVSTMSRSLKCHLRLRKLL